MNDALKMQACNCKQRKPNKEKLLQSRIAEEQKTLDPFNKVRLLFLFTNLFLSLSLFFVLCLFLNSQFLIGHWLAVLDSIIKIQNSLHLPSFSQQPQNHLKKQENWYISPLVVADGIYYLLLKGFEFAVITFMCSEVNLSSKHIGREREVLLKSFKIVYVWKKTKRKKNVQNGGLGNLEWLFFLLKKVNVLIIRMN